MKTNLNPNTLEYNLFERQVDMQGRLRLPNEIKDQYGRCVVFLGWGLSLHLTTDGVWLEFNKALTDKISNILDEQAADLYVRMNGNRVHLTQDVHGRIAIPIWLLKLVDIEPGSMVIGTNTGRYWRLTNKKIWLAQTGNQALLEAYREAYPDE